MSERRHLTADESAKLKKLHATGLTDAQIAQIMEFDLSFTIGQRAWLGLTANGAPPVPAPKEPPAPREKPNPIQVAENLLGERFVRTQEVILIDGVPRKADYIVRETNRLLVEAGLEQVGPPHWRI